MTAGEFLSGLFSLGGRTAVVTGGTGVLGGEIAAGLARAGARVAVIGRSEEKLARAREALSETGPEAMAVACDCLDAGALAAAAEEIEARLGPVRILVNAAGGNVKEATVGPGQRFFDAPPEALRSVVDLNLFAGTILPVQAFGARMAAHGQPSSVVNVSSMAALRPLTRVVGYGASKAAVDNLTKWLAVHFLQDLEAPIRVNAIAPGFFLTEQNRFLLTTEDGSLTDRGRTIVSHTPARRFGSPEDLVGATVWLASDASAFVTGTVIPVDGGFSAFSGV